VANGKVMTMWQSTSGKPNDRQSQFLLPSKTGLCMLNMVLHRYW